MQQDLKHEKLETLKERANKLADQIAKCIEVKFRSLMQRERLELIAEIELREERGGW